MRNLPQEIINEAPQAIEKLPADHIMTAFREPEGISDIERHYALLAIAQSTMPALKAGVSRATVTEGANSCDAVVPCRKRESIPVQFQMLLSGTPALE